MQTEPREETLLARGKRVARVPSVTEGEYWWISDQEILTLRPSPDPRLFMLGLVDARTGQEKPLDAFNRKFSDLLVGQEMHVTTEGDPTVEIVFNPPQCGLSPDRATITSLDLEPPTPAAREVSVRLPRGADVGDAALSESGDRLAWIMGIGIPGGGPREFSVCIGGPEGEDMRELGRMRGQSGPSATSTSGQVCHWPQSLRWTPDGGHVSLVFREELYGLSAR